MSGAARPRSWFTASPRCPSLPWSTCPTRAGSSGQRDRRGQGRREARRRVRHQALRRPNGALPKRVIFVDSLPKNPIGKLLKRRPRQRFVGGETLDKAIQKNFAMWAPATTLAIHPDLTISAGRTPPA